MRLDSYTKGSQLKDCRFSPNPSTPKLLIGWQSFAALIGTPHPPCCRQPRSIGQCYCNSAKADLGRLAKLKEKASYFEESLRPRARDGTGAERILPTISLIPLVGSDSRPTAAPLCVTL